MATIISTYYVDELREWQETIDFCTAETDVIGQKFADIIRRDSIESIAGSIEAKQVLLNNVQRRFNHLKEDVLQQVQALKPTDGKCIDDTQIGEALEKQQEELRKGMQSVEKDYIDIKYGCYHFLSSLLKHDL